MYWPNSVPWSFVLRYNKRILNNFYKLRCKCPCQRLAVLHWSVLSKIVQYHFQSPNFVNDQMTFPSHDFLGEGTYIYDAPTVKSWRYIDNKSYKWFGSFLAGRSQQVKIGRTLSSKRMLESGVPQGGILSPIIFVIYGADIELWLKHSSGLTYTPASKRTQLVR